MQSERILFLFDFDETIVSGNTDVWFHKLLKNPIQEQTKKLARDNWRNYVQKCYNQIHQENTTCEQLEECFKQMQLNEGMDKVLELIRQKNQDAGIISDSNTLQVKWVLDQHGYNDLFKWVITNKGSIVDGRVVIENLMDQMECNDCLRNICKNKALRENIDLKSYDKVFYFGDGFNDFCPSKLLQEKDILFCRKGFRLEKMVDSERQKELRCKIVKWNNGFDILNELNA